MKQSIRSVLLHAIKDYKIKKREQWVLDHPGQCVLNGSQVNWTFEVEERIAKQNIQNHFS